MCLVLIYLKMKKLKDTFDYRPTRQPVNPSIRPPVHPSQHGLTPAFLRFEHWTPKGDCKVTGNKERN